MRRVMVFKREYTDGKWATVQQGEALFHQFAQDHEEYDSGPGIVPVAIVEFPDGDIASRHVHLVRFLDHDA